jgi:hypothetical protein
MCFDLLQNVPGIQDAAVFGNSIHAVVEDPTAASAQIRQVLGAGHCRLNRLEPIPPRLEDVFVSLMASRERNHEVPA